MITTPRKSVHWCEFGKRLIEIADQKQMVSLSKKDIETELKNTEKTNNIIFNYISMVLSPTKSLKLCNFTAKILMVNKIKYE
jgi:hypothetical protein